MALKPQVVWGNQARSHVHLGPTLFIWFPADYFCFSYFIYFDIIYYFIYKKSMHTGSISNYLYYLRWVSSVCPYSIIVNNYSIMGVVRIKWCNTQYLESVCHQSAPKATNYYYTYYHALLFTLSLSKYSLYLYNYVYTFIKNE